MSKKYKDDQGNVVVWEGEGTPTDDQLNQLFDQTNTANGLSKFAQVPGSIADAFPIELPQAGTPIEFSEPRAALRTPPTEEEMRQQANSDEPFPQLWEGIDLPSMKPALKTLRAANPLYQAGRLASGQGLGVNIPGEEQYNEKFVGPVKSIPFSYDAALVGAENALDSVVKGFTKWATSQTGMTELALSADPLTAGPMAAKFAVDMARGLWEQGGEFVHAVERGDTGAAVNHLIQAAINAKFAKETAHGAYKGSISGLSEAGRLMDKEYYSTPKGQQEMGEFMANVGDQRFANDLIRQRDEAKTDAEIEAFNKQLADMGVDPDIGLTPEMTKMIDEAAKDSTRPIKVVHNSPFVKLGYNARMVNGTIEIYPENLVRTMEDATPARAQRALESIMGEEDIHSYVTKAEAERVWNDVKNSPLGQKLYEDIYQRTPDITDAMMGHEYIRYQLQMLRKTGSLETTVGPLGRRLEVGAKLRLDRLLNDVRDRIHQSATGEASPARKVIDAVNNRIEASRRGMGEFNAGEGETPASRIPESRTTLEDASKMSGSEFFDAAQGWSRDRMEKGIGAGPQVQAEILAATTNKDPAAWKSELDKIDALRSELKSKAMTSREALDEYGKLSFKRQFMSEGFEAASGIKPLSDQAKEILSRSEGPASKNPNDPNQGEFFDKRSVKAASLFAQMRAGLDNPEKMVAAAEKQKRINALMEGPKVGDEESPASKTRRQSDYEKLRALRLAAEGIEQPNFMVNPKPSPIAPGKVGPAEELLGAAEYAGAVTPAKLEQIAQDALNSEKPSFQEFERRVTVANGRRYSNPEQMREMWQASIGKWLEGASAKQIENMVNVLKLRTELIPASQRKKGAQLNIPESNLGESKDALALRTKQLERASQIDKNVANIESEIRSLEKRIKFGKSGQVPESELSGELLPVEELRKSTLTGDELRLEILRKRAEMYRRESRRLTIEARPNPSKVVGGEQVESYESPAAPPASSSAIQPEFRLLEPVGPKMGEGSLQSLKEGPQKSLMRIKSAIFKTLADAGVESKPLNRKDLTIDDLDWNRGNEAVRGVTAAILRDPEQVGIDLTAGAGVNRATKEVIGGGRALASREAPNVTHTKALVAFLNPNGKVELVSAYRDGRRGPVVTDPLMNDRHITFEHAMQRYKVLGGYLLESPVKDFHRQYDSISKFNDEWHNPIKERADQFQEEPMGIPGKIDYMAQGTEGLEGEGGFVMGPTAMHTRLFNNMIRGALEIGAEITPAEAGAVYRVFRNLETQADAKFVKDSLAKRAKSEAEARAARAKKEEVDDQIARIFEREGKRPRDTIVRDVEGKQVESKPRLMRKVTKRNLKRLQEQSKKLEEQAKSGLTPGDHLVLNAMRKVEEQVRKNIEEMNREIAEENKKRPKGEKLEYITADSGDWTLNELFDLAKSSESEAVAAQKAASRYQKGEQLPPAPQEGARTGRELTMRSWGKRNIEAVPFQQQPVVRPEVGRLTPAERAFVRKQGYIEKGIGTRPTERPIPARDIGPGPKEAKDPVFEKWMQRNDRMRYLQVLKDMSERNAPGSRLITNALRDIGSSYDEWMADRLGRAGGSLTEQHMMGFKYIVDRAKELYGLQTKLVDAARMAAGGSKDVGIIGQVPSLKQMKAVHYLNKLEPITKGAATVKLVDALESWYFRKTNPTAAWTTLPKDVKALIELAAQANLEAGKLLQSVSPKFTATGKFQRNYTAFGVDIIRNGGGTTMGEAKANLWREFTIAMAKANKAPLSEIRNHYRELKTELDKDVPDVAYVDKINQDFARKYPKTVTHLKTPLGWEQMVHSDLFNYIETTARRAANIVAFREQFPNTPAGRKALGDVMREIRNEVPSEYHQDLKALIRTLEGHPTDTYQNYGIMGPNRIGGMGLKMFNQTIGNLMAKLVLSGQMIRQPSENIFGSTPQFLGYKNYLRGMARLKQLYPEMEKAGERNAVIYDFAFDRNSPIRSLSRMTGNAISKVFMEQMLNELQEASAAATARVVSERIKSGNVSSWEARQLPETFRKMGFTKEQAADMMKGNVELLNMFQRRAAAWLTSGNRSMSEGSKLGSNRLFNSVLRFQSYPMMKMNQFRQVAGRASEAWLDGGTKEEKLATAESLGRFMVGSALQGFGAVIAASYFFNGGMSGVQTRLNEAKDQPGGFMAEMFMATIGGPMYLIWQAMNSRGALNMGDTFGRLAFPYHMARQVYDAAYGLGQYRDMDPWDRLAKFSTANTPALKAIQNATGLLALSQNNPKLDSAIGAFYRFQQEMPGYTARTGTDSLAEDRSAFRNAMKKAVIAIKTGDREAYDAAFREASLQAGGKGDEAVPASLRSRKILKAPDGRPLTPDQTEALINRIGEAAYERLRYYDEMLEAAADGYLMPRQE